MEQSGNTGSAHAIRVGELRSWHIVTVRCGKCRHEARVGGDFLAWERPPRMFVAELQGQLRCTRCGNRADNTLTVQMAARN